jgi:hypothetical protein
MQWWGERPREPVLAKDHFGSSAASPHQSQVGGWHCQHPPRTPKMIIF